MTKLSKIIDEIEKEKDELFNQYKVYSHEATLLRRKQDYEKAQKAEDLATNYLNQYTGIMMALNHFVNRPWRQLTKTELYGTDSEEEEQ